MEQTRKDAILEKLAAHYAGGPYVGPSMDADPKKVWNVQHTNAGSPYDIRAGVRPNRQQTPRQPSVVAPPEQAAPTLTMPKIRPQAHEVGAQVARQMTGHTDSLARQRQVQQSVKAKTIAGAFGKAPLFSDSPEQSFKNYAQGE